MLRVNELLSWLTWLMLVEGQRSAPVCVNVNQTHTVRMSETMKETFTELYFFRSTDDAALWWRSFWALVLLGALLSTQPDHEAMFTLQRLQITDDVCRFESWRWCNAVVLQEFTSVRSSSARVAAAAHHHPVRQTQTAELDSSWQIHHYIYL